MFNTGFSCWIERDNVRELDTAHYNHFSLCLETRLFNGQFWREVECMEANLMGLLESELVLIRSDLDQAKAFRSVAVYYDRGREGIKYFSDDVEKLQEKQKFQVQALDRSKEISRILGDLFYLITLDPDFFVTQNDQEQASSGNLQPHKEFALVPHFDKLVSQINQELLNSLDVDGFKEKAPGIMRFLSLSDDYLSKLGKERKGEPSSTFRRRNSVRKIANFYHKLILEIEEFQLEIRQKKARQEQSSRCVIL